MQKDVFCLLAKIQVITNCVLTLLVDWFDWLKNQASAVGFAVYDLPAGNNKKAK